MNLQSIRRHLGTLYRYHGVGAVAQSVFLTAARKILTIEHVRVLAMTEPPVPPVEAGRGTLLATPEDLSEIAGRPEWDMGDTSYEDVLHLYEDGHRCVLNIMDGEIAGYSWMNPDRIVIPKLGVAFSLNDDELYIYKGFTHERFRGRRLGADRFARWMSEASKFGARRLIVDFAFDNRATTVRIKRLGLTMIGTGTLIGRKSRCIRRYSKGLRERHVDLIDPEFVARNGAA